jgi:hypothetical protein
MAVAGKSLRDNHRLAIKYREKEVKEQDEKFFMEIS